MHWFWISILTILLLVNPTIKYWDVVINNGEFKNTLNFFISSMFTMFFICAWLYFVVKLCELFKVASLIPYFLICQFGLFAVSLFLVPLCYIIIQKVFSLIGKGVLFLTSYLKIILNMIPYNKRFSKRVRWVKNIFLEYFSLDSSFEWNILDGNIIKKYLIMFYIVSGILTVSGLANSLVIELSQNLKYADTEMKDFFDRELQLYSDVFLMTALPILLSAFVNKKLNPRTEKESA